MPEPVVSLDPEELRKVIDAAEGPVLVDFWATWCGPCRLLAPIVEELGREFAGRATVAKVDVDRHPAVAASLGIQSIPTLVIFHRGEVVDRLVGLRSKPEIEERLSAAVNEGSPNAGEQPVAHPLRV